MATSNDEEKKMSDKDAAALFWGFIFCLFVSACLLSVITDSIVKIIEAIKK